MIDSSPLLLILFIFGCSGIIMSIGDLIGISLPLSLLLSGFVALLSVLFWFLYTHYKKMFIWVTSILTGLSTLLVIPRVYFLTGRIKYLLQHGIPVTSDEIDLGFILLMVFLISFLLFSLEFIIRNHSIMLAGGLVLMFLMPVFGHSMNYIAMAMLGVFEFGFIVVNMSEKRSTRSVMTMQMRSRINVMSVILALCVIGAAVLPALVIELPNERILYNAAYQADGFIKDIVAQLTGRGSDNGISNGNINRGNLYQSGRNQIMVSVNQMPAGRLYLKGYTGKNYQDSNWDNAFNFSQTSINNNVELKESFINDLFTSVYEEYLDKTPYSFFYLMYDSSDPISEMYYMLADTTLLNDKYFETVDMDGTTYLQVNHEEEATGYLKNNSATHLFISSLSKANMQHHFIPYFASDSEARIASHSYNGSGYGNFYLKEDDINAANIWEKQPIFNKLSDAYISAIQKEYTAYPSDTFSRMEALCRQQPLTDLNDITTFILVTLQNRCVYSTTPGSTPYNKDVIDYFLFENGQGYCVHFASAAALMYRMYGIPARYVTGFVANSSDFSPNEQYPDYFSARLTDKSAHAWVEIFLKDYGWVPVEVTPDTNNMMHASYPGYDDIMMRSIMSKYHWSFRSIDSDDTNAEDDGNGAGANSSSGFLITLIILTPFIFAAFAVILFIRRRRIIASLSSMSCKRLFDRTMRALHYSKLLKNYTGSEEDFPEKLAGVVTSLSGEDTRRIIDIVLAANYSDALVPKTDRDFMEQAYRSLVSELYSRTFFLKKPLFKYLHAFC